MDLVVFFRDKTFGLKLLFNLELLTINEIFTFKKDVVD